jgi:hypothetical protein
MRGRDNVNEVRENNDLLISPGADISVLILANKQVIVCETIIDPSTARCASLGEDKRIYLSLEEIK